MNRQKVTSIDNAVKLIKTLLELNLYEDWIKMDIHVKTDSDSIVVEWKDIPIHSGAGFRWVDEDQDVLNRVEYPDGTHEYALPDDIGKSMETWIRNNPDWKMTSYGTWTNEEENRLGNIENSIDSWSRIIEPNMTKTITKKDNLVTVISDVPEKIASETSYVVFGDGGLHLLAREKGERQDSPNNPGKVDGTYKPDEPVKMDKIDCAFGEKETVIHRYYSSSIDSDRIYFVNDKHKCIYLVKLVLGDRE